METVQFLRQTGNYQFPSTPLSGIGLPLVGGAVASACPVIFESNFAYQVDRAQHSAFCLRGYQSGLLADTDMDDFASDPSLYALHKLTSDLVSAVGACITFDGDQVMEDAEQFAVTLTRPKVDEEVIAKVALGLIDGGVLDADILHDTVSRGSYTAPLVLDVVNEHVAKASNAEEIGLCIGICDSNFVIEATQPRHYNFNLSSVPAAERDELNVALHKAFDALSRYTMPFHTPYSFCGKGSYFVQNLEEAVTALQDITSDFSVEGLAVLIKEAGYDVPFELEMFDCQIDDDESVANFAALIASARKFFELTDFTLGNEATEHANEIRSLLDEARTLSLTGKATAAAHGVIAEILEYTLAHSNNCTNEPVMSGWDDMTEEGMGLFETFSIRFHESEFSEVYAEADSYVDMIMQETCSAYVSCQVERDVVARTVVRTMGVIKKVDSFLTTLSSTIEAIPHA